MEGGREGCGGVDDEREAGGGEDAAVVVCGVEGW